MDTIWLAIDSGNTRVKWALMENNRIVRGAAQAKERFALPAMATDRETWISHVGSAADLQRLRKITALSTGNALSALSAGRPPVHFIKSRRECAGVYNSYQPPSALGADRWLCLLAAQHLRLNKRRGVIVVSAGTALTIDILSAQGDFRGGFILPGLALMPAALSEATPLPKPAAQAMATGDPPRTTKNAIRAGALLAATAAILAARRRHAPGARLVLTGGDARYLSSQLPAARLEPQLIFYGMACLRQCSGNAR